MTSNAIRSIRRKKSSLSEVKIVVIGAPGVGKSALTVRFLTKRYIQEYDHQTENHYKNEVMVDNDPVIFEIIDTSPRTITEFPKEETLQWADGFMLVYSIIDKESFDYIREAQTLIQACRPVSPGGTGTICPIVVIGNKVDLIHLRQVEMDDGVNFAKEIEGNGAFWEVTAAEQVTQIAECFFELFREVNAFRRRSKQSLLDRLKYGSRNSKKEDGNKKQ